MVSLICLRLDHVDLRPSHFSPVVASKDDWLPPLAMALDTKSLLYSRGFSRKVVILRHWLIVNLFQIMLMMRN